MEGAGSTDGEGAPSSRISQKLEQHAARKKKREVGELNKALRKKKKNERKMKEEIESLKLKMYDQAQLVRNLTNNNIHPRCCLLQNCLHSTAVDFWET